jgi:hypothetical protein
MTSLKQIGAKRGVVAGRLPSEKEYGALLYHVATGK